MKKIFVICSLFLLLTGCGKVNDKDVVKEFGKNINKSNGYILNGELEILNNDEVYNYDVEVGHKKDTYYKVTLTNKKNDHTQVILKNDEGVFILTPSLNKSFKFQSDWPYSNSQVYLLGALYSDMENDDDKEFKKTKDGYELITKVSYPNNKKLIKQKILFDNKFNLLEVKVYDKDDLICMSMKFDDIDYSPNFKDNYFEIGSIMSNYSIDESKEVASLEEILYPLFIPEGTRLTSEERIETDNGERVILTFDGDKSFLLVEEVANVTEEFTIIPTYGEPFQLMDTLGVMTDSSLSWSSNGIEYYLISDVMNADELVEVAQSIYAIPTISIK